MREVCKPILAASAVVEQGCCVWLHKNGAYILGDGCASDIDIFASMVTRWPLSRQRETPSCSRFGNLCPVDDPADADEDSAQPLPGEGSEEATTALAKTVPQHHSPEQVAQHELVHVPFRSWCKWCIIGQAPDELHKRGHSESTIPLVALTYRFLWKDGDTSSATALVFALRPHGVVGEDRFAVHCVLSLSRPEVHN